MGSIEVLKEYAAAGASQAPSRANSFGGRRPGCPDIYPFSGYAHVAPRRRRVVAHGVIKSVSGGAMILGLPLGSEEQHSAQEKLG
jgi:hypothetical protein